MLFISAPSLENITGGIDRGAAHASLGFAAARFERLAYYAGIETKLINMPDIYRSSIALQYLNTEKKNVNTAITKLVGNYSCNIEKKYTSTIHLTVAHWTQCRLLLCADCNIAHISWEQSCLPVSEYAPYFGANMIDTLHKFDRIWACADFITKGLKEYGIKNTITFPTPICDSSEEIDTINNLESDIINCETPIFSPFFCHEIGTKLTEASKELIYDNRANLLNIIHRKKTFSKEKIQLFITQGGSGDERKGTLSVMIGFSLFAASYPGESYLIVKTSPRSPDLYFKELEPHYWNYFRWGWWGSKNIFIIPSHLSLDSLYELYNISDYYICCPVAEGQNVPLQEAIQHGCYPITPLHTAMLEYLTEDTICKIETQNQPVDGIKYCGFPLQHYYGNTVDYMDIADACQRAIDTPIKRKKEKIYTLQTEFLKRYTFNSLSKILKNELDNIHGI